MKVAHVLPNLGRGGAERVAIDLANYAAATGHEVTVVLAARPAEDDGPDSRRADLDPRVEIRHVADSSGRLAPYFSLPGWMIKHRAWILDQHVVHCHLTFGAAFGSAVEALRTLKGSKGPAVVEDLQSQGCPMPAFKRWLHMRLVGRRDAFVMGAEDPHWRKFLDARPNLYSPSILNGIAPLSWGEVSAEQRAQYRAQIGIPPECRWVVLTLGRLVDERQPELYLPIFRKIADAMGPAVHFVYAGGGPAADGLLVRAAEVGLAGRVHVTGLVTNPALPFSITDVYLTPGVGKVIGIAGIEAVFSQLPVVAVQWLRDYDNSACTWIKSSRDPEELARYVTHLLLSPEARSEQVNRQNEYAHENLRLEVMTSAYDELYARLVQKRGIGAPS